MSDHRSRPARSRIVGTISSLLLLLAISLAPWLPQDAAGQGDGPRVFLPMLAGGHAPQAEGRRASDLYVSSSPDGSDAVPLRDAAVSGTVYVFVKTDSGFSRVRFYLNPPSALLEDPRVAGRPSAIAGQGPASAAGPASTASNNALDTTEIEDGKHAMVAAIDRRDGGVEVISANFSVVNAAPALLFTPDALAFDIAPGQSTSKTVDVISSDGGTANYGLSETTSWLSLSQPTGATPASVVVAVVTDGLTPGDYTGTITASAPGYTNAVLNVSLRVSDRPDCTPIPCAQVKVNLPYTLDWSRDHGMIVDANGVGTGFTYIDQPSKGTGYLPGNIAVNRNAPGTLRLTTTSGIQYADVNSLDNALGVGIDAPSQVTLLRTTLRDIPINGTAPIFEQAGLWFGNNEDNYVKLIVLSSGRGMEIQHLLEVGGVHVAGQLTPALNLAGASVTLSLRVDPTDRTITASYQINGATEVIVGQFVAPPEFFSFDAAGVNRRIGTNSFGGIFATHRNAPTPDVYTFDSFSVSNGSPQQPPPTGPIAFERSSFPIPNPTNMVWGPDNRLYVTEMLGPIHAITLNDAKAVIADQVITTLGSRLTLGIAVDPQSTPSNVILWVGHSSPTLNNGQLNSGTITRLSGPGFTNRQDVITGLPRAIADHAVNSIHFGPDGKLYIAVGGNTGAGAPNNANTGFGARAEQPLSAAILVADVRAPGFRGSCAQPEGSFGPPPCDVVTYATGIRNAYDFVFHSNGSMYSAVNGLGVVGTFPPLAAAPCTGFGNPAMWNQGGHNPGHQTDFLIRVQQGRYSGHPNPYRNECVFMDGSYQNASPLNTYTAPMFDLGEHRSPDGMIEYRANAFGGALKGDLLIANYSVGDDITRIRLSSDGRSVVEATQLAADFNNPLPLVEGPDGTIYVGEHGGNKVTALKPVASTTNPTPTRTPSATRTPTPTSGTPGPSITARINFQNETAPVPTGYIADFGQPFDTSRGFGWVVPGSSTPLNLVGAGRDRDAPSLSDQRLDTLMHLQLTQAGAWEFALPNGTYDVTLSAGDASFTNSTHHLNVEGVPAISAFSPTTSTLFRAATVRVTVSDGRLTIDAIGGTNSKINYVDITSAGSVVPGTGNLVLDNLDGVPFSDRLVFNRIQSPNQTIPNYVHDVATTRIRNTGTGPLRVTGLTLSGPWQLVTPIALPVTIAPNAFLDVAVKFIPQVAGPERGVYIGSLLIASDDADEPRKQVELAGFWQAESERGTEPTLQEIMRVFGYATVINYPGQLLNRQGLVEAIGEEVLSPYWQRANPNAPVSVRQLAAYHSQGSTPTVEWFAKGTSNGTGIFAHAAPDGQTLLPRLLGSTTQPAAGTFTPTVASFGFKISSEYSDPAKNNQTVDINNGCPGPCGHHMRFWPVRDRSGAVMPNTWLMGMDYSGINYDYNDNMYLISNIKPEAVAASPTMTPSPSATRTATPTATPFQTITWSTVAAQPFSNSEAQGAVVNGKFYSLGGFDSTKACCTPTRRSYVYDPTTNQWTAIADLPKGVTHAGITTDGQSIYYAGGYIENANRTGQIFGTREVWKYDPATNQYTALPALPIERAAGQLLLVGRNLHYIGGTNLQRTADVGDHYVLSLDGGTSWQTRAVLPNPRHHAAAVVFGGKIYYIGGQHGHDRALVPQSDVHVYDPATNSWSEAQRLPFPRNHASASTFVMGSRIIVAGGQVNHGQPVANVTAYDPATNTWTELTPLPAARHSAVAAHINNIIFFTTGGTTTTYKGVPGNP